MGVTEVAGFVTGALSVWLTARQSVWNFPVGVANSLAFAALFLSAGLYAGAGLQVVYLVLGVLGWRWWLRGGREGGALEVRRTPVAAWPALAAAVVLTTLLLAQVLGRWTDSPAPLLDAVTTSLSLVAQVMLGRKWLAHWLVWVVADVLFVLLYASQGLWLTALLYAGFIGLCVHGLRSWRASLATPHRTPVAA